MSDDERYQEYIQSLKPQEALDRLRGMAPTPACPICGNRHWLVEGGSAGLLAQPIPTFVPKDTRMHFAGLPSIPALALSCGRCGFIRLHNITVLNRPGNG